MPDRPVLRTGRLASLGGRLLHAAAILFLAALPVACGQRPVGYEYHAIAVEGWEPSDTLAFSIDTLPAGRYRLTLGLRTSASKPYPYRSLTLLLKQEWHPAGDTSRDTVVCTLTTPDGDLSGRGVSFFQYDFPLDTLCLTSPSVGRLSIRHIMRHELLPGISDIGIRLDHID